MSALVAALGLATETITEKAGNGAEESSGLLHELTTSAGVLATVLALVGIVAALMIALLVARRTDSHIDELDQERRKREQEIFNEFVRMIADDKLPGAQEAPSSPEAPADAVEPSPVAAPPEPVPDDRPVAPPIAAQITGSVDINGDGHLELLREARHGDAVRLTVVGVGSDDADSLSSDAAVNHIGHSFFKGTGPYERELVTIDRATADQPLVLRRFTWGDDGLTEQEAADPESLDEAERARLLGPPDWAS